jgi:hypothetical protein
VEYKKNSIRICYGILNDARHEPSQNVTDCHQQNLRKNGTFLLVTDVTGWVKKLVRPGFNANLFRARYQDNFGRRLIK